MGRRVGFARRSLVEMAERWRGIELFFFIEATPVSLVDQAVLLFGGGEAMKTKLLRLFVEHFALRITQKQEAHILIENRLWIHLNDYRIEVSPIKPIDWSNAEFDLLREIDQFFRQHEIQAQPPRARRAFYRGYLVTNARSASRRPGRSSTYS